MTVFTQLNPPVPMYVIGKGNGLAIGVTDYGCEYHLLWTVVIDDTGEIWTMPNPQVRGQKNISMGRLVKEQKQCQHTSSVLPLNPSRSQKLHQLLDRESDVLG